MKLRFTILSIFLFAASLALGQKESNIWYFGNGQGLDFNHEAPVAISDSFTYYGPKKVPATICDSLGEEILFSNGFLIRNLKTKTTTAIPGLFDSSETSTTLNNYIIQSPGNKDEYFILSSSYDSEINQEGNMQFKGSSRYQKVRFAGQNKDSLIQSMAGQEFLNRDGYIAAFRGIQNTFYWVVVYAPISGRLYIHKLTENGISSPTKVYWMDTTGYNPDEAFTTFNRNDITFSSDGSQLAFTTGVSGITNIMLVNFDQNTGTISNYRRIMDVGLGLLEFSYSGEFLYTKARVGDYKVYQCSTQFSNSIDLHDTTLVTVIAENISYHNGLIGPDGKIYLGGSSTIHSKMGIIHFPDKKGTACGFDSLGMLTNSSDGHLPRYVLSYAFRPYIQTDGFCLYDSTSISLHNFRSDSGYLDFGDGSAPAPNQAIYKHVYPSEGSYTLSYIYYRKGMADTFNYQVTVNQLDQVKLGPDTLICADTDLILDASDPNAQKYVWNTQITNPAITIQEEGIYAILVQNGGCVRTDSIRVLEIDCGLISSGNCFGDTTRFQSTAPEADSMIWDYGDGRIDRNDELITSYIYSDSGSYPFQLILFRDGLQRSVIQTIQIIKTPVPNIGPDTLICDLEQYILDAQSPAFTDYLWSNGSPASKITLTQTGTIWLRAGKSGCFAVDSASVYFIDCTFEVDSLCFGQTSVFEAHEQNLDSITWDMGDGTLIHGNHVNHLYFVEGNFSVNATLHYQSLSKNILIPVTITKIADPILLSEIEICENTTFIVDNNFSNYTYTWNNGIIGPELKFDSSGHYIVHVESNGCILDDSVTISLIDCSCFIYIPNAFTPDENGLNETFSPSISCAPQKYSMQVYNRWGELLFESSEIEKGWDGTYKNQPCEPGLYLYVISYSSSLTGLQPTSKGTVLLIR